MTSLTRRIGAQARFETTMVISNGEQVLLAFIIPIATLIALVKFDFWTSSLPDGAPVASVALASTIALAVSSAAFVSPAIVIAFDRQRGVLRMLGTTPLGRGGLIAGKIISIVAVVALQIAVLFTVALFLGWRPFHSPGYIALGTLAAIVVILAATACFGGAGIAIGGSQRPEFVLGAVNLLWIIAAGSGLVLPLAHYPQWLGHILRLLPPGAFGQAMREIAVGHIPWIPGAILTLWAIAMTGWAKRVFSWD